MTALRPILILFTLAIAAYTAVVMLTDGPDFFSPFFATVTSLTWLGQFTFDFALYLALSGLWIAWRGGFSAGACVMGAIAATLGMLVFAPYLLVALHRANGDPRKFFLGVHAG